MASSPVQHAVTRDIWGDADTVLLIFAGAAAEFALNRAVDWLFFTGALPRDPIGRLFRTVRYAQNIAFATAHEATHTLNRIRRIHASVERGRGEAIPAWAHRAVLYMLIDYSERAAHLLRGPLGQSRQEALYGDFRRIGQGLGIGELPTGYTQWRTDRARRLQEDLAWTPWTDELYRAYRCHLGPWRHELLRQLQSVLVPPFVREQLKLPSPGGGALLVHGMRTVRTLRLGIAARRLVLPLRHWRDLMGLEKASDAPPSMTHCSDRQPPA
jgi:uncharacterized protein (DUF2236 family)